MAGDGASEGLWGCSIVGAAAVVHPWGAGGGASSLEGCRRRLPEEIGPRMRWAKHLRWPDDTLSRRTNH